MLSCLIFLVILSLPALAIGDVASQAEDASKNSTQSVPVAFALYKEKAEQGDVEAQYNIGVMCETGWSVPVDNKKAVRWYREAAKQGHANAQIRLGMLYYLGVGAHQSEIKGRKWIREAAKQNNVLASNIYKKVFSDDVPEALSPGSVVKQVREAYLKNEKQALTVLDRMVSDARQQEAREEQLKKESTMRERRIQRLTEGPVKPGFAPVTKTERIKSVVPGFIGNASLEENRTLARGSIATIRLQAEKGLASAQYNLGRMYELGIKLPVDKERALEWYKKSAQQAYADAEYRLGIALLYGVGVSQDEMQGKQWLTLAAKHGHAVAKKMADSMRTKLGSFNISMAANWYFERALAGDAKSSFHLGKLYQYGWGVEPDNNEAMKWYRRASDLGFQEAGAALKSLELKMSALKSETATKAPPKKNKLEVLLKERGLPVWLVHPGLLITIGVLILLYLIVLVRRMLRNTAGNKQKKIQEV